MANFFPESHFFGSTPFNWATGQTRAEVMKKLAVGAGSLLKGNIKNGGLYAWTCEVNAPEGTSYDIEHYRPVGVEFAATAECLIQNVKGHSLPTD